MVVNNILEEIFYYSHTKALFLLIIFIVFGRSFIENLKNKRNDWKRKALINGIISAISFMFLILMPLKNWVYVFWIFLQSSWAINGLLGSISLLQTEHLSEPEIAFNPPQLPLMFFFIKITPNDIKSVIIKKNKNAKINKSIIIYTIIFFKSQLLSYFKFLNVLLLNLISLLLILSMKRTAIFSFSAIFNPCELPKTKNAVAQPSAFIEFSWITVTDLVECVIGFPVFGLIIWEYLLPFFVKKFL